MSEEVNRYTVTCAQTADAWMEFRSEVFWGVSDFYCIPTHLMLASDGHVFAQLHESLPWKS